MMYLPMRFLFVLFCNSTENFTSWLKIYKVELGWGFTFDETEVNHKVLRFGSKASKFSTCGKYNSNKKVQSVVKIYVSDKFDEWF